MVKKVKKQKDETLVRRSIYVSVGDWKASQSIAKRNRIKRSQKVREWVREGIEREKDK